MPQEVQWVLQGGALLLLAYLIIWGTRTGGPKLFESLRGIQSAVESNTGKIAALEQTNRELSRVVGELAAQSRAVGEETLSFLKEASNGKSTRGRAS